MAAHGWRVLSGGVAVVASLLVAGACSASGSNTPPGGYASGGTDAGGGASGNSGSSGSSGSSGNSGSSGTAGSGFFDGPNDANLTADTACAEFTAEAKQTPAAMQVVIDKSTSMAQAGKWTAAQTAIVTAIDASAFDDLTLGLLAYPAMDVAGPSCAFGLPVSCGVTALPQVALGDTGTDKSTATSGVRKDISSWLSTNPPVGSATPGYDALNAGIQALQALPLQGRRLMLLITDGGFTCASLSSRPGYADSLGCADWEYPDSVVTLLTNAYDDASKPVWTFIVGVPGSDTHQGDPEAPPYSMRLALSAFAYAGSPTTVDPSCDGTSFAQSGGDPSVPCHYDLTSGSFDAQSLADTLSAIRGTALGCTYDVPEPPGGGTVNPDKVNVNVSGDGGQSYDTLPKRSDPTDDCAVDPCWDYDSQGQVELLGKACADVKASTDAKVQILGGCDTIVK